MREKEGGGGRERNVSPLYVPSKCSPRVLRVHAASFFSLFSSANSTDPPPLPPPSPLQPTSSPSLPPPPPPPGSAAPFSGSNIDPDIFPSFFFPRPYERHFQQFFLSANPPPTSSSLSPPPHVRTTPRTNRRKKLYFSIYRTFIGHQRGFSRGTGRIFLQFRFNIPPFSPFHPFLRRLTRLSRCTNFQLPSFFSFSFFPLSFPPPAPPLLRPSLPPPLPSLSSLRTIS